ncbi:MAG: polysaccharide deacetylase family protein [Methylococcales bacterium]
MMKPIASLSLDLDNQWSYMKIHGDSGWESFPSYFETVVPRFLEVLNKKNLTLSVFVVGQDAAIETNHKWLKSIADAGHEIANHSFHHDPWLHLYTEQQIDEELASAEQAIENATGFKPVGFRGPGFSLSESTLRVLLSRGYRYDASTFPTFLGPLARAYYFMTTKLSKQEKEKRKMLFGSVSEGFRPIKGYYWKMEAKKRLLEIPVTTIPIIKSPFHFSYLLYLCRFSPALAKLYFSIGLRMCLITGVQPSILLHPLDFLNENDVPVLGFFPGMNVDIETKLGWVNGFLDILGDKFSIKSMAGHAEFLENSKLLKEVIPNFPQPESS